MTTPSRDDARLRNPSAGGNAPPAFRYCALARCACLYFCASAGVAVVVLLTIGAKVSKGGSEREAVEARATGLLLLLATCEALIAGAVLASADSARKLDLSRRREQKRERARVESARRGARSGGELDEERIASPRVKKRPRHASPLRTALRLLAPPDALRDDDEDAMDDDEARASAIFDDELDLNAMPPLTRYERGAIGWALFTGLIHIFLDGTVARAGKTWSVGPDPPPSVPSELSARHSAAEPRPGPSGISARQPPRRGPATASNSARISNGRSRRDASIIQRCKNHQRRSSFL